MPVMTTSRNTRTAKALVALAAPLIAVSSLGLVSQTAALASAPGKGCAGAYGWPVRPFAEPHPVRANFGDPRTRFAGPNTDDVLLAGDGTFSFHQGVDISAPDGAPVYAVASGTVVRARGGRATIDCGNGRSIQYWHVDPVVRVGQRAVAGETVVGFIQPKREHVHLTHLQSGRAVNPLAPGHLTPYRDATVPVVTEVSMSSADEDGADFVVEAVDMPAISVPGRWHGFPVSPALVTWRIERGGRVVVSKRVVRDVRRSVPKNDRFWDTFARGTHQNWPIFGGRKLQFTTGRYLFEVSIQASDTRGLRDGTYDVVVIASDTAGNHSERRIRIGMRDSRLSLSGS